MNLDWYLEKKSRPKQKRRQNPEKFKDIVDRWLKTININKSLKISKVFENWKLIVEKDVLDNTTVAGFSNNELKINVHSNTYYYELSYFRKREILKKLQEITKEIYIRDIKFICDGKNLLE